MTYIDCESCHLPGYRDDYGMILDLAAGTGELLGASLCCPHCGDFFELPPEFLKVGYRVRLEPPPEHPDDWLVIDADTKRTISAHRTEYRAYEFSAGFPHSVVTRNPIYT